MIMTRFFHLTKEPSIGRDHCVYNLSNCYLRQQRHNLKLDLSHGFRYAL